MLLLDEASEIAPISDEDGGGGGGKRISVSSLLCGKSASCCIDVTVITFCDEDLGEDTVTALAVGAGGGAGIRICSGDEFE